nr:immunoglobulin light chain junction region [Macaca mulatta]
DYYCTSYATSITWIF